MSAHGLIQLFPACRRGPRRIGWADATKRGDGGGRDGPLRPADGEHRKYRRTFDKGPSIHSVGWELGPECTNPSRRGQLGVELKIERFVEIDFYLRPRSGYDMDQPI